MKGLLSAPPSASGDQNAKLLLETSRSLLEIAQVAWKQETDDEERIFYSHLQFHCLRFVDQINDSIQTRSPLDEKYAATILSLFGSLVGEADIQELPSYSVSSDFRLKALNLHWGEMRCHDDERKLDFIRRWLKLEAPIRQKIDSSLEQVGDGLTASRPAQDPPSRPIDSFTPLMPIPEPSYAVGRTAQSIFDALIACKACNCNQPHEFAAKLSLGTYRVPTGNSQRPTGKRVRNLKRKVHVDNSMNGELDFDMFLSMAQDWHEVKIKTEKETRIRWTEDDNNGQGAGGEAKKTILGLCHKIAESKRKTLQRLVLKLTRGRLFELGFERSSLNFVIDQNTEPISLSRCFEDRHHFFTEKVKRILSLILAYTVLHLHGTDWLQPGWGSSCIKFFQTTRSKTPLRPFIQTQLPHGVPADACPSFQLVVNNSEECSGLDELDPGHQCPALVALAVILMEVYFVTPFKTLAKSQGIELIEEATGRVPLADALLVFYGEEEDGVEGCGTLIPEDSFPLMTAIEACLNGELWEDDEGNPLDDQTIRPKIYQEIIRPLEAYLSQGFSQIPLEGLEKYAQKLDFGNWGQLTRTEQPEVSNARTPTPELVRPFSPTPAPHFQVPYMPPNLWESKHRLSPDIRPFSPSISEACSMPDSTCRPDSSQFFDDEAGDPDHSGHAVQRYINWRSNYDAVYRSFIPDQSSKHQSLPVKIAILDTGVDLDHSVFEAREDNIKGTANWYGEGAKRRVPDRHGHGTFNASLLLDYCPDAELYVAKISDKENIRPNASLVAKAIDHAVKEWKVDILSMSFGWPTCDFDGYEELEAAIDNANTHKVLMFAAASNSGGRQGRAYPARNPHVVSIHSTDTYGTMSTFSPTASMDEMNLATVGESIKSAWPSVLCDENSNPSCVASRSGTSYATPIAAGIAAFLMQYARVHLTPKEALALKRRDRMMALLKRIAQRGANYQPRDGYYYIELSRHGDNLFGKQKEYVDMVMCDVLRG